MRILIYTLFTVLIAGPALAHDMFLIPDSHQLPADSTLNIALYNRVVHRQ